MKTIRLDADSIAELATYGEVAIDTIATNHELDTYIIVMPNGYIKKSNDSFYKQGEYVKIEELPK